MVAKCFHVVAVACKGFRCKLERCAAAGVFAVCKHNNSVLCNRANGCADGNGVVGYGLGKAGEVSAAIAKGVESAKKNLIKVSVLKGTIPHEQTAKYGGARVLMRPAAPGTGVVAGGAMRAVFESVGIKDVLAKSKGSSNPHNLVKATVAALAELRDANTIAETRNISLERVFKG